MPYILRLAGFIAGLLLLGGTLPGSAPGQSVSGAASGVQGGGVAAPALPSLFGETVSTMHRNVDRTSTLRIPLTFSSLPKADAASTASLPSSARAAVLYGASAPGNRWFARDKALHVTYSFLWTLSSQYVLMEKTALSHDGAIPWALASGFAVGVAKETYDRYWGPTGRFSWRDMAANAVGLSLAAGVLLL